MANRLQELRARLQEKETRQSMAASDNAVYPFWNIPENSTATLRLLPDGNESNDFFWIERLMIRLPFAGVVGKKLDKEIYVQVPCMEMWGDTCPVLTQVRPWFKDPSLDEVARKYWKKKSYLFQGFVRSSPFEEQNVPENPIRRLVINPSIFDILKSALMDPEMEDMPTDYEKGFDFRLTKTMQGNFASYKTSQYSRKNSSLTANEIEAIEKYGLHNLADFLPKKPNAEGVNAISELFEASVNGEPYDPERWGEFYKPSGMDFGKTESANTQTVSRVSTPASKPVVAKPAEPVVEDELPWTEETPKAVTPTVQTSAPATEGKKSPAQVLAEIKARAAQQKGN